MKIIKIIIETRDFFELEVTMFQTVFENIKNKKPRIHSITNYVTVNDVANAILAIGGQPIMADEISEVAQIQTNCDALNLNMGTLNQQRVETMIEAGKQANKLCHPIILDPVGVGASSFRIQSAKRLLQHIHFDVIKGNMSEIKTLVFDVKMTSGVDQLESDKVNDEQLETLIPVLKEYAKKMQTILVITGEIDLVLNEKSCYIIKNGHEKMSSYTGSGCQLSGLISCFVAANQNHILEAVALAVMVYGISGEIAAQCLLENEGNITYKNRVIDILSIVDYQMIKEKMNYEIR